MLTPLLLALASSLLLTLLLEGVFALIWGVRGRRDWLLLLLVNVVSNPIVVTLFYCVSSTWVFTAVLEAAAVAAEGLAYRKWGRTTRPAMLFALCANCFSFFGGILIQFLMGGI